MIENKFEVIRNEEEDKNNILHKEIKEMYMYYKEMGVNRRDAIRYAKWTYKNLVEAKEDE